jgi:protein TonB
MVCGSCGRRRVDPNSSFCDKCGSSVFVAERQRQPFRSSVADARAAFSTASPSASAQAALRSVQDSAKTSSAAVRSAQRSARSIKQEAARRAAAAGRGAPRAGIGRLVRFAIVVFILWTAVNWLLEIPEVIAVKEAIQHGQLADEQLRAAQEAVSARLTAMLGGTPATPPAAPASTPTAPRPAPSQTPRTIERPDTTRSGGAGLMLRAAPATARVPPGVSPVGNGVSMPRVLHVELPRYAPDRLRGIAEGTVILHVVVRPHGEAGNITVVRSPDPRLEEEAIAAVRRWRFAPGLRDGQPIPVLVEIEIPPSTR